MPNTLEPEPYGYYILASSFLPKPSKLSEKDNLFWTKTCRGRKKPYFCGRKTAFHFVLCSLNRTVRSAQGTLARQ